MAAKEPYDYLSTIAADVNQTLIINAQGIITEKYEKNQAIRMGDDGSEERVNLSNLWQMYVSWSWDSLSFDEAGTVMDLYLDPAKADGKMNSFKWRSYDGHTYVVRFDCEFTRAGQAVWRWGVPKLALRILGRIADP